MDFLISIDHSLFEFLNSTLTHPWLDVFFPWITDLHKSPLFQVTAYPLIFFSLYYFYGKKSFIIFLSLFFCIASTDFIGSQLIKKNVNRLRPGDNPGVHSVVKSPYGGTSFISNHSANMFAFASFTSVFLPPMTIPFYFLALLAAYSRVYVGVHFPLDVLFGGLFGYLNGKIFSFLCLRLFKLKNPFKKRVSQ